MISFNSKLMENGKTIDIVLLDTLKESEIINESVHRTINAHSIIEESREHLLESRGPDTYTYLGQSIDRVQFDAAYSNIRGNLTPRDIFISLGVPAERMGGSEDEAIKKALNRAVDHFNKGMDPNSTVQYEFPKYGRRVQYFQARERGELPDANMNGIDAGSRSGRNKTTSVIDKINKQEILDGEFYSNMTRIPKTRWNRWFRLFDRQKSSIRPNPKTLGRQWKKTFMLGYQVSQNVFYEIWYNTFDSTFTVHDRGGIEMSVNAVSMTEAVRDLIRLVMQESDNDKDFFSGTTQDARRLSGSITRALVSSADSRADELIRADEREAKKNRAEMIDYFKKKREAKEKQERIVRAAKDMTADGAAWTGKKAKVAAKGMRNLAKRGYRGFIEVVQNELELNKDAAEFIAKSFKSFIDDNKMDWDNSTFIKEIEARIQLEMNVTKVVAQSMVKDLAKAYGVSMKLPAGVWDKVTSYNADIYHELNDTVPTKKVQKDPNTYTFEPTPNGRDLITQQKDNPHVERRKKELKVELERRRKASEKQMNMDLSESEQHELIEEQQFISDVFDNIHDEVNNRSYDRNVVKFRKQAEKQDEKAITQELLRTNITEDIRSYDQTRVNQNFIRGWFDNTLTSGSIYNILARGSKRERIKLPTDRPSLWQRAKMAVRGQHYRADFVSGWSYMGRVNIEIWYVTEPNPNYDGQERNLMIASFYVFDVSSGQVTRRFLPHYRNALQVALGKLIPIAGRT